jgi:hypothetical protein
MYHQTWRPDTIPIGAGQLILENIKLNNVPVAVTGYGSTILPGGTTTIQAWGQGNKYSPNGPEKFQGPFTAMARPQGLLDGANYYSKSKPQYENLNSGNFISARGSGATGNGNTDDTNAVQNAINLGAAQNKVVFFEHGKYHVHTNEVSLLIIHRCLQADQHNLRATRVSDGWRDILSIHGVWQYLVEQRRPSSCYSNRQTWRQWQHRMV